MALELTDQNFESHLLNNDQVVVLDFSAQWCGPCKVITPIIEEMAEEYKGKALIGKVDVDTNPGLSSKFGVRNMPTILYLKSGEVVDKHVGATTKAVLENKLDAIL